MVLFSFWCRISKVEKGGSARRFYLPQSSAGPWLEIGSSIQRLVGLSCAGKGGSEVRRLPKGCPVSFGAKSQKSHILFGKFAVKPEMVLFSFWCRISKVEKGGSARRFYLPQSLPGPWPEIGSSIQRLVGLSWTSVVR